MNPLSQFLGALTLRLHHMKNSYLFARSKRHIAAWGEYTYGEPTILNYDGASKLSVGRYCSIAGNVTCLLGANHKKSQVPTYPLSRVDRSATPEETNDKGDIVIGNDVWIGFGATIIGPVTIGDGAIIGAGAVITKDVPAFAVCVGNRSEIIRYRFTDEQMRALARIAWWKWDMEHVQNAAPFLFSGDIDAFIEKYTQ